MRKLRMRDRLLRMMAAGLVLVATTTGTVAVGLTTTAAPAQASVVAGSITRTEVLARAKWWMDTYGVVYSQSQSNQKSDGDGHYYRPDCSGFVSMAWHLPKKGDGWDRNTGDLADFGDTTRISLGSLRPGDAILGESYGHVALFDKWANADRTQMWVYDEYGTGKEGRHIIQNRSWYASEGFVGLHYNRIRDGAVVNNDFDGDGDADVLARNASTKDLHLYRGNGSGGFASGTGAAFSNNWSAFDTMFNAGDFDGDGDADVLARNASTKDLHLYRGNGSGGFTSGTGAAISNNWSAFDMIFPAGDFDGDGDPDVLARNASTKNLHLYRGNGSGGFVSGTGAAFSNNWSAFDRILSPGDFDGDGDSDILARNASTKDLHLYRGNGSGGFTSGTGAAISNNWSAFDMIFSVGDFDRDGDGDVLARASGTKDLWLYRGNGSGGFSSGAGAISNNWSAFDRIF
ncbi:FG-GAP-like repeat-containing protein [Micromonospora sp. URMC 105]|uniref:FG-GAP repeat domain-containing protein n=1 Tax=Micromonospora sp. URMC 105 TaxID=3423413 RepID=UPI003F1B9059